MTGAIATIAGMFPGDCDETIGFCGSLRNAADADGAVIFVDFWLVKKLGLQSNYAEISKKHFNWAAGLTWFITLGVCWWLVQTGRVAIYFVSLPGWFFAAALYVVLSFLYQKKLKVND